MKVGMEMEVGMETEMEMEVETAMGMGIEIGMVMEMEMVIAMLTRMWRGEGICNGCSTEVWFGEEQMCNSSLTLTENLGQTSRQIIAIRQQIVLFKRRRP